MLYPEVKVLDHGFVRLVEIGGHGDAGVAGAGVVEAARQSTQGTYRGWGKGDSRLVNYMALHHHATPFEFADATFEVRLPIMVSRQWVRHRSLRLSFNEVSGRYGPLPSLWYLPTLERLMAGAVATDNRQASSTGAVLTESAAIAFRRRLDVRCRLFAKEYKEALDNGVTKELARLGMPMSWYTQFRVKASLRDWAGFVRLRDHEHAQLEIQDYAREISAALHEAMPEVWDVLVGPHA